MMNQGRKSRRAALARELQLPSDQITDDFHIEFFGRNHVITDGCIGVVGYSQSEIRLNLSGAVVTYEGGELEISSYDSGRIEIGGDISAVLFK